MARFSLSADDLPPLEPTTLDRLLRRQLDEVLTRQFAEWADSVSLQLLSSCEWYVTTYGNVPTLVINCPDSVINWKMLHHVQELGSQLQAFSKDSRIRICPPIGTGDPFEIRVDELPIYEDRG